MVKNIKQFFEEVEKLNNAENLFPVFRKLTPKIKKLI